MPPTLVTITPELQLSIVELLSFQDHINLSSTCKALRSLLVPFIFAKVPLKNTEESGKAVNDFIQGPYASHIKSIHLKFNAPGPQEWVDLESNYPADDQSVLDAVIPESVEQVLSNTSLLPGIDSLIIEVPTWTEAEMRTAFYLFDLVESDTAVIEDERIHAWRRLMARTYELVAGFDTIRHLEIREHVPKLVSTWNTPAFQKMLSGLKSFTFTLRGAENGAGWNLDTCVGWVSTTEAYGRYLFDHLINIETLEIESCNEAPLGLKSNSERWFAEFKVQPFIMPKLRHLTLKYVLLCPELRDLICAQSEVLETVKLINSGSEPHGYDTEESPTWAEFLDAIAKAAPKKLRSFQIVIEQSSDENKTPQDNITSKEHLVYYCWDTKYGSMPVDYWERPQDDDQQQKDENAFDKLMAIVQANHGRDALES
ncbi:hypothetical protein EJ05DRAFT_101467 [Pseudovirgaria hyperparasitica]|uniref:F-box domain-containing protein n=1 Tax=Pseudovirgaria hyperparasitica TaxID=470096 RepID=A0A6A6VXV4_9PEZI|nr:uncharacterized protein EJ05DRAFT_101467 [Pseudovirgaria hyperparasitica]KAF2755442.1 hypothetical protein EJ05DRAFT_101467 [Pseudovirgaria hyperparasitica]